MCWIAGDIGTGAREIGYLFGAYKKLRNEFTGMLTGKGVNWGGSFIRPEATGYGLVYFVEHVSFFVFLFLFFGFLISFTQMVAKACPEYSLDKPSTLVAISGSGNVAQHTALKLIELGATVLSLSDSKGSLISEKGFTKEFVQKIAHIKLVGGSLETFSKEPGYTYHPGKPLLNKLTEKKKNLCYTSFLGKRPWTLIPAIHIALPGATQNEVSGEEAEALVIAGARIVAEGSNMGCTTEAIDVFEASRKTGHGGVWYAPGSTYILSLFPLGFASMILNFFLLVEASNCGGVAVSGLEMAQNSQRLAWTSQEVDAKLKGIMAECYNVCFFSFLLSLSIPILTFC